MSEDTVDQARDNAAVRSCLRRYAMNLEQIADFLNMPVERVKRSVDALQGVGQISCKNNIWRYGP